MTGPVHVHVKLPELSRQLALRGWSKSELARRAGKWPPAISRLYGCGWCSPQLYRAIAAALAATPVSAEAETLLEVGA